MDYFETVAHWHWLQDTIKVLQAEEKTLREGLFSGTFPNPVEGAGNKVTLPDGRVLQGTHVINRKLIQDEWLKKYKTIGIPVEVKKELIVVKYDFNLKVYRQLPEDQRKRFETVLEIKPGLPKLELLPPKEQK